MEATWSLLPTLYLPNPLFQCTTRDHLLHLSKACVPINTHLLLDQVLHTYICTAQHLSAEQGAGVLL